MQGVDEVVVFAVVEVAIDEQLEAIEEVAYVINQS